MAHRTASQLANRRRIETLIRLAAPALDVLLYAGDRLSRVAGRNEIPPAPEIGFALQPRKLGRRATLHGPPLK